MKKEKKSEDGVKKILQETADTYEKAPASMNILECIFRNWHGDLFISVDLKQAIAVYPNKAGLVIEFFETMADGKYKFVDRRCITISDYTKEKLSHMMHICEIIAKHTNKNEEKSFDYHG